jgi:hypothetical protein
MEKSSIRQRAAKDSHLALTLAKITVAPQAKATVSKAIKIWPFGPDFA